MASRTSVFRAVADFSSIRKESGKTAKSLSGVGKTGTQSGSSVQGGMDQADQAIKKTSRSGQFLGKVLKRTLQAGAVGAGAALGAVAFGAVKSATNLNKTRATLTGLYGSASQATDILQRLRGVAEISPIQYRSFTKGAEALAYMGVQGKDAEKSLRNVGDAIVAAGGSSEDMSTVNDAMLDMVNTGKVYAEQLSQISGAGVPVFSGLAAHFGTNIGNVRKMVEEGKVSIDDVMAVIRDAEGTTFKSMKRAAKEVSGTLSAQFQIAKDNVVTNLGAMLEPLTQKLVPVMRWVSRISTTQGDRLGEMFEQAREAIQSIVRSAPVQMILEAIGEAFTSLTEAGKRFVFAAIAIWQALRPLVEGGFPIGIGLIVLAFKALAAAGWILVDVFHRIRRFVLDHTTTTQILAGVILGTVVAVKTYQAVMRTAAIATAFWTRVTKGQTKAQRILNAVMRANLIGVIVTALILLVAGFVLAYKKSETFRKIVHGALEAVGNIATWLWEKAIKPAFGFIVAYFTFVWKVFAFYVGLWIKLFKGIAAVVMWLWRSVIKPVFKFIWTAAKVLAAVVLAVLIIPLTLAIRALAALFRWWWKNVTKPVFNAIADLARWLWRNGLKPIWDKIVAGVEALGDIFTWLWENVVRPIWRAIRKGTSILWNEGIKPIFGMISDGLDALGDVFRWLWRNVIRPIWDAIKKGTQVLWDEGLKPIWDKIQDGLDVLGDVFRWLWRDVIRPIWNAIKDGTRVFWREGIKPIFDAIKNGLDKLGEAFEKAKDFIGRVWPKIANVVRKPINWVIRNVYNHEWGIRGLFNKVARTVGLDARLPRADTIPAFQRGGRVRGRRGPDQIDARLTHGEFVQPTPAVDYYGVGTMEAIRRREIPRQLLQSPPISGYQGGGLVTYKGHTFTPAMKRRLQEAEDDSSPFVISQGGFRPYTSYSAGTHMKDAVDIIYPITSAVIRALRGNRIVAWDRTGKGDWAPHIHGIPVPGGGVQLSPDARAQWRSYQSGGDGLGGRDTGPRVTGAAGGGGGFFGFLTDAWKKIKNVGSWLKDRAQAAYDFVSSPAGILKKFIGNAIGKRLGGANLGDSFIADVARKYPRMILDGILERAKALAKGVQRSLFENDERAVGSGSIVGGANAPKAYAKSLLDNFGWGGGQWPPLEELWTRESGWRHTATNPSSGAYGIPQALPGSQMASAGNDWRTNWRTQIRWGLGYVDDRYGSPAAALAFHNANNWYGDGVSGAVFRKPTMIGVGDGGPERVDVTPLNRMGRTFGGARPMPVRIVSARPAAGEVDGTRTVVFQTTVHNPVAERTSDSLVRRTTRVAQAGLFSGRQVKVEVKQ